MSFQTVQHCTLARAASHDRRWPSKRPSVRTQTKAPKDALDATMALLRKFLRRCTSRLAREPAEAKDRHGTFTQEGDGKPPEESREDNPTHTPLPEESTLPLDASDISHSSALLAQRLTAPPIRAPSRSRTFAPLPVCITPHAAPPGIHLVSMWLCGSPGEQETVLPLGTGALGLSGLPPVHVHSSAGAVVEPFGILSAHVQAEVQTTKDETRSLPALKLENRVAFTEMDCEGFLSLNTVFYVSTGTQWSACEGGIVRGNKVSRGVSTAEESYPAANAGQVREEARSRHGQQMTPKPYTVPMCSSRPTEVVECEPLDELEMVRNLD
ncbi:hypothetical protein BV20DRAFT_976079 [Pilatotrama ljubarskyi]|nr:hypothetical protein BV20DRAFT_976079 [Pilatotrama ljubarskyi]